MLFEPQLDIFESLGLRTHESVVTVLENGCMYVPVQNCDRVSVRLEQGTDVGVVRCVSECIEVGSVDGIVADSTEVRCVSECIEGSVGGIVAGSTEEVDAYLEHGVLLAEEKLAKKSGKYEVIQGILYFEPGRLCIVVLRPMLLQEAHTGCFAGHFSFKKVYDIYISIVFVGVIGGED